MQRGVEDLTVRSSPAPPVDGVIQLDRELTTDPLDIFAAVYGRRHADAERNGLRA
jgi:hypothetical protein